MSGTTTEYYMGQIGSDTTYLEPNEALKIIKPRVENYIDEVINEDGVESYDDYEYHLVNEKSFDEDWARDEHLRKSEEIKAKYKELSKNNRVMFFEIGWN